MKVIVPDMHVGGWGKERTESRMLGFLIWLIEWTVMVFFELGVTERWSHLGAEENEFHCGHTWISSLTAICFVGLRFWRENVSKYIQYLMILAVVKCLLGECERRREPQTGLEMLPKPDNKYFSVCGQYSHNYYRSCHKEHVGEWAWLWYIKS